MPVQALAQDVPYPVPSGFESQCHTRAIGSGQHCHVVPKGAFPKWKAGQAGTIVAQIFTGILGGAAGAAVVGGGLYLAAGGNFKDRCGSCETFGIAGAIIGVFPGEALGVWGIGELLGGNGSYGWTLVGALVLGCVGAIGAYHFTAEPVYDDQIDDYDRIWAPSAQQISSRAPRASSASMVPILSLKF